MFRIAKKSIRYTALLVTSIVILPSDVSAQRARLAELDSAYAAINQQSLTATISFLASDELAGRDTPSKELDIAAAYVAARFRGTGLLGGGDNESYYQSTQVATVQLPVAGIEIRDRTQSITHFGLLAGDAASFSYDGPLTFVSAEQELRQQKFHGPVYFNAEDLSDPRSISKLARQTAILKSNGATAILIPASAQDPIVGLAQQKRQPTLVQPRGGIAGPTLLVSKLNPEQEYHIEIPAQSGGEATVRNVIGILPGSDPALAQEAILFSAHLDHIGNTIGSGLNGDAIFNGADDDASGVTAVLTLADAYAALPTPPKRTTLFVTYWGEEKGLLGSRYYANQPTWPLNKIVANINIEMIGRPEPGAHEKIWVTGWEQSNLGSLMNRGSQTIDVLTFEHPKFSEMLYRASDNYSLVEKGVVAHSFSAGSLHDDYHRVSDEWEKLDLRHMARVIEGLFAGSLPIANGELTPVKASNE